MGKGTLLATGFMVFLLATPAAGGEAQPARPDCLTMVINLDVSGSMRAHGFDEAKEAVIRLLHDLRPCDIFYIIPFAETKLEGFRGELTAENRAKVLAEAEAFVRRLRPGGRKGDPYGHYTNLDEGIDAATLALLKEPGTQKGMIVLISDGISDPDPLHQPVDLNKLAERIPKGAFSLYLIDLAGNELPGLERTRIGAFEAASLPKTPLVVIPLEDTDKLLPLLRQVEEQERNAPPLPPQPEEKAGGAKARWLLPVLLVALAAMAFFLKARKQHEPPRERRVLLVGVDGQERRYGLPVKLTIGSSEEDTIRVAKAKPGELKLRVGEGGDGSFRHNGQRGGLYGGRQFTLSNGTKVEVRVEALAKREGPRHRYLT